MSTSRRNSDQVLADRISRREESAVAEFQQRFTDPLDRGFDSMARRLSQSNPPGCQQQMRLLVRHVAGAAGEGFLKLHGDDNVGLDAHVPALALPDLFHVSACLEHDDAACLRLVDLVDREIGVHLVRRFRQRLSEGRAQEIVGNVLSHVWSRPGKKPSSASGQSADEFPPGPSRKPRIRLERYFGLSTLKTWLYALTYRMLLDETRKPDADVSLDLESTSMFPTSPEFPPDVDASIEELVRILQPKFRECVESVVDSLKDRPNPRLAHVAYLWLNCRAQQVDIARWTEVTKARVSQQVREISELVAETAAPVCRNLADAGVGSLEEINQILKENLRAFAVPSLFKRLLESFQALRAEQPVLLQLAYLKWHQHRDLRTIVNQLCDSESRVIHLTGELDAWRARTQAQIVGDLHEESGVPLTLLEPCVQKAFENDDMEDIVAESLPPRLSLVAG